MTNTQETAETFRITWEDDWSVDHVAEFDCYEDEGPSTCEGCTIYSENGDVLASLWCIDDADDEYRQEIERQLIEEAVAYLSTVYVDTWRRLAAA